MNAVERILHYTDLPSEAAAVTKHDPPPSWPDKGEIQFTDVKLQYREKLPLVLDGVSFHIRPGEKVHVAILFCLSFVLTASIRLVSSAELGQVRSPFIISKTFSRSSQAKALCFKLCSGKLLLLRTPLTLFLIFLPLSTVELIGGKIEIDGYDISTIGLDALRRNIALVPQDNVLFLGTLRQNMLVHWFHSCHYLRCLLLATLTKPRRMLN